MLFEVAGFFVCLVLIEYVVCSVLIEHVQRFEPQVGCSHRDSALQKCIYHYYYHLSPETQSCGQEVQQKDDTLWVLMMSDVSVK